jgi:hypothetical protein
MSEQDGPVEVRTLRELRAATDPAKRAETAHRLPPSEEVPERRGEPILYPWLSDEERAADARRRHGYADPEAVFEGGDADPFEVPLGPLDHGEALELELGELTSPAAIGALGAAILTAYVLAGVVVGYALGRRARA